MAHSHTFKLALTLLVCGAGAALAPSSLAGAEARGTESFAGVCEMSGVIHHQPPMTNDPAPTRVHGRFSGVCSGQLTDRDGETHQLDGAPARYEGRGFGELSCLGGTAPGTGRLVFERGRAIEFTLTERRIPGVAVVTLQGAGGGSATVVGTVSRDEDLAELNERCSGPGLRFLRGDARIVSPGISG
jgi:hypothetical protein